MAGQSMGASKPTRVSMGGAGQSLPGRVRPAADTSQHHLNAPPHRTAPPAPPAPAPPPSSAVPAPGSGTGAPAWTAPNLKSIGGQRGFEGERTSEWRGPPAGIRHDRKPSGPAYPPAPTAPTRVLPCHDAPAVRPCCPLLCCTPSTVSTLPPFLSLVTSLSSLSLLTMQSPCSTLRSAPASLAPPAPSPLPPASSLPPALPHPPSLPLPSRLTRGVLLQLALAVESVRLLAQRRQLRLQAPHRGLVQSHLRGSRAPSRREVGWVRQG